LSKVNFIQEIVEQQENIQTRSILLEFKKQKFLIQPLSVWLQSNFDYLSGTLRKKYFTHINKNGKKSTKKETIKPLLERYGYTELELDFVDLQRINLSSLRGNGKKFVIDMIVKYKIDPPQKKIVYRFQGSQSTRWIRIFYK